MSRRPPTRTRYQSERDDADEPLRSLPGEDQPSLPGPLRIPAWVKGVLSSWPLLLVGALIGPAIAAAIASRAPVTYTAEALVAPNRTITQVNFTPEIKTVGDSSTATQTGVLTPERRQALVDLVRSSNVEDQVISDLGGKVPDAELQHGLLIQHVIGGIRPRSEILSIQASASSPSDAMLIANAWASTYVDRVNRLYSDSSADPSLLALRDQARQELAAAETNLSASMQSSTLESLDRQIQDKQALLTLLQTPYQTGGPDASSTTSAAGTGAAQTGQPARTISNDYRLADRRTLDDLAQTLRRLDVTRENARSLLNQAQSTGGGAPSDTAALAILKTQLVAISDGLPSQLQLQLPSSVSAGSLSDIQALAASLDQARTDVAREFDARRATYEANSAQQVGDLENQLRDLRAQREAADAERKRLTASRDLASDTYTALAKKAEERRVATSAAGHEVQLASEASFASPLPRQSVLSLAISAALGLTLAAAVALTRWYLVGRRTSTESGSAWPMRAANQRATPH